MTGPELSALLDRVQALEQSVEDLMTGGVPGETLITTTSTEPEIRVRISHAHTLKDGWRCDGTTVEWTGHGEPDLDQINRVMEQAHQVGQAEAVERNLHRDEDGGNS